MFLIVYKSLKSAEDVIFYILNIYDQHQSGKGIGYIYIQLYNTLYSLLLSFLPDCIYCWFYLTPNQAHSVT